MMSLKQSFSNLLSFCIANKIAFSIWRFPNTDELTAILSDTFTDEKPCDLSNDRGFCISSFSNEGKYILLKPKVELQISLSGKTIKVVANDEQLIATKDLKKLITNTSSLVEENVISSSFEQTNKRHFTQTVQSVIDKIKASKLEKVVISKFKEEAISNDEIPFLFKKLYEDYPSAFCYLTHIPNNGIWIGASPETLLSYNREGIFKTVALAGTQDGKGIELKEAVWRQKEIEEQALVSRYIMNCFKAIRLREFTEKGPKTIKAGSLLHLISEFEVDNKETNIDKLPQTMLELLHPTSAVCGMPLKGAQQFIQEAEKYDREFYTGFLGPVNFNESTKLFVNLRCGKIYNGKIRLFAGAGITEDSDPDKEWIETEMKCQTILNKLEAVRHQ
jgi:isochorismate synthase